MSISLEAQGEISKFYADGIVYYSSPANNGYEGDFETALVPEEFRVKILGEVLDDKGVLIEKASANSKAFAFAFEVEGDKKGRRNLLYNCTVTRPSMEAATSEDSKEVQTDTITLSATPLPGSELIKATTSSHTDPEAYENWYQEVYYRPKTSPSANLVLLDLGEIRLEPEFDPALTMYTASTERDSGIIKAEAVTESAEIRIMMGSTRINNGSEAIWAQGENVVTVTVTAGETVKAYTVSVTKTGNAGSGEAGK